MASTSEGNSILIDQFCSVTGASREKAYEMLVACNWNLEMAINKHVDSDFTENATNAPVNVVDVDDSVRSPIPQWRGILVEEDYGLLRSGRRRRANSVFGGIGDFQAEPRHRRALEDLFRPPFDLMHRGTFESARDSGQSSNRWLMVNIQNYQEFACQALNRDVWSHPAVKSLINEHFVFWQVDNDCLDGERYIQFYAPYIEFPYVAVIDPRTGENLVVWHNVKATTLQDLVNTFLKENSLPAAEDDVSTTSPSKVSLVDQSEDDQFKAALAASLNGSNTSTSTSDNDNDSDDSYVFEFGPGSAGDDVSDIYDLESFESDSGRASDVVGEGADGKIRENWIDFLGAEEDPKTELLLRLPDGKREQITWPCTTKLKSLLLYIDELGFDAKKYELVTNFPRRNLSDLDSLKTLKESDLFPREVVIVQSKT